MLIQAAVGDGQKSIHDLGGTNREEVHCRRKETGNG
jgi:hypothetical protein